MYLLTTLILAQMPWTSNLPTRGVAVDFLRPKFDGGGTTLTSGALYLSGRFPVGGMSVKFELPYARIAVSGGGSSATVGNAYIGLETGNARGLRFEGGVRLPLTSETQFASVMGFYSDITRFEAFLPNVLTVAARANVHRADASGFTIDAGLGPSLWVPTEGNGDTELVLHDYFSAGYRGAAAWMSFGIGGIMIVTEDLSLADRTVFQLGASAGLSRGPVRPALHLIIPLDQEVKSDVDLVVGLGVAVAVP